MKVIIDIPEDIVEWVNEYYDSIKAFNGEKIGVMVNAIKNGTPLPKGHGRLVDISKIDDDRIESDNPIIYLTINGDYIEAVSLDYLYDLPTIVEADKEEGD